MKKLSNEDFDELCEIAQIINDFDDMYDIWVRLNEVINNITE